MPSYLSLKRPVIVPGDGPTVSIGRDTDGFILHTDKVQGFQLVPDRRPASLLVDLTLKVASE